MKALVLYQSMKGTTKRAGQMIASELQQQGHEVGLRPVSGVDLHEVSIADVIFVGTWTDGLFFFGQRPGQTGKLLALPGLWDKRVVPFCTYAINAGATVTKLGELLERKGAVVTGGRALHRKKLDTQVPDFVRDALTAVPA